MDLVEATVQQAAATVLGPSSTFIGVLVGMAMHGIGHHGEPPAASLPVPLGQSHHWPPDGRLTLTCPGVQW